MAIKGTINTMVDGVLQEYFPKTTYDSVVDGTSNLKTDIDALKSFKTTAGSKLDGIANNATKTEKSTTNGNIKINGTETTVYTHPSDSNTRHVTDAQITSWTAKETTSGAQSKADAALTSAKSYTDAKVAAMVASAPETLDTLNELAAALGNDPNFATTIATQIGTKVDKVTGKGLSTNDYTTAEKNKLAGIATGANNYTHPTTSGNKHIPSGGSAGQILRWSADGTAVWGADNNTTYSVATTSANGLMSSTDKKKLDGIAEGANKYTHPTTSGNKHIPSGGSAGQILRWSSDGTAVWGADNNTTYSVATASANGLMSASDKAKLDGATNTNTASKLVMRDASGNFSAGTITASLSGNASTATKLQTARTLTIGSKGKTFDGSANVTWTLAEIGAASTAVATTSANGLMSSTDKSKLDTLSADVSLQNKAKVVYNSTTESIDFVFV